MKKSSASKKQKQAVQKQPLPELNIYPRRGRSVVTLVFCLVVLAVISDALLSTPGGAGIEVLFIAFFLICLIYLLGLAWSALRQLSSSKPSFQANDDGLTMRHLPFLGHITIPWPEIKSIHAQRSRFSAYLCIMPQDAQQLVARYGILRFVFNASTRINRRINTPLALSQSLLTPSVEELARRMQQDYGVKGTPGFASEATKEEHF